MNTEFLPNFKYIFTNPFFITRRYLYVNIRYFSRYFTSGTLLDIGCGTKPYRDLFLVEKYVGMDYAREGHNTNPFADVFYDGKTFPLGNDSFDSVLATEVLEHVFNPVEFMLEIRRVLKPGGLCLITVPFVWDEHEQPYDYGRYTSYGLKHLVCAAGFEILEYRKTGNFSAVLGQIISLYLYYIFHKRRLTYRILLPTLFAFIQGGFLLCSKIFPKIDYLYLDNIIFVRKPFV